MKRIIITESQYKHLILKEAKNDNDVLNKVWITYGTGHFDNNRKYNVNIEFSEFKNKPMGTMLWASPVNSTNGWDDFCARDCDMPSSLSAHFIFKLDPNANIYTIDDIADLEAIAKQYDNKHNAYSHPVKCIDFQLLQDEGYDGIYVTTEASYTLRNQQDWVNQGLYAWDVESICIWNNDVVIPLKENAFRKAEINHQATQKRLNAAQDDEDYDDEWWMKPHDMNKELNNHRNLNVYHDSSKLFNGIHPGILAQGNDTDDDTMAAKHYKGTIKSAMNKLGKLK